MAELLKVAPDTGSYVSESDYFEPDWQRSYWGSNYSRLADIKRTYAPAGLFFVHNGVGSEEWSANGFTRQRPWTPTRYGAMTAAVVIRRPPRRGRRAEPER